MSSDDQFIRLQDFVSWVRKRRAFQQDAWVDEQTLEYVTQGVERFLAGETPWTKPQEEKPKRRGRPQDPETSDTMWKCFHLACVVGEDEEFLPQYCAVRGTPGGFDVVAKQMNLSAKSIEGHARKAEEKRKTPDGMLEYCKWLTEVEKTWWCYHAACVEKKELKLLEVSEFGDVKVDAETLHLTRKELDEIVSDAQKRLKNVGEKSIYQKWLDRFNRRDEKGKAKPLQFMPLSPDDPRAKAMDERRAAAGLRIGRTKAGRPRKNI